MKNNTLLIMVVSACGCIGSLAQDVTNRPVRIVISKSVHPLAEKMEVSDTNAIGRIVALFPGYEKQPQNGKGAWIVECIVHIHFADGREREILVADNKWKTTEFPDWTPLTTNWASILWQTNETNGKPNPPPQAMPRPARQP